MLPAIRNLLEAHTGSGDELLTTVLQESGFRLEHITSNGAASPPGFWYDQDKPEWVALLRGSAILEFEEGRLTLKPGDSLLIPAHARHRVADTSSDAVWLALHLTTISMETKT